MANRVQAIEVWAGDIQNKAGMLARVLEAMATAGAQLEFMIARRVTDHTSRVFLAPIKGKKQVEAAGDVGLVRAKGMFAICVEAANRAGLAAQLTRAVAAKGVNLRGASAAAIGNKARIYLAFATKGDMQQAMTVVKKALKSGLKG